MDAYLTNPTGHALFETAVAAYESACDNVQHAALGYLGRTILAAHENARWLELDWGCSEPARLHPGEVLDIDHATIATCDQVDEDLYRVPSYLDAGPILSAYTVHAGAGGFLLDLPKAAACHPHTDQKSNGQSS